MNLGYAIPRDIVIKASANMGFIVKVGCGEFVAANEVTLFMDLKEYIKDPKKWEEDYNKLPGNPQEVTTDAREPERPLAPPTAEQDEARG